jgi:hypothetical protein
MVLVYTEVMVDFDVHKPTIRVTMGKFSQAVRELDPPQQFPAGKLFQLDGLGNRPYGEKDACVQPPNVPRSR